MIHKMTALGLTELQTDDSGIEVTGALGLASEIINQIFPNNLYVCGPDLHKQ